MILDHKDATDQVRFRLAAVVSATGAVTPLGTLKRTAKQYADRGVDPSDAGIVELGLLLPTHEDYESLKAYVNKLQVKRSTRRRRK